MSTVDKKIEPDKIHILSIKTMKGNIDSPSDFDIEKIAGYHFEYELKTGTNRTEQMIGLQLTVNIDAINTNEEHLGITGSYTHEIIFRVENLEVFITESYEEQSGFKIDVILGSTLVSIAYSTIRGIIYNRTQGTSLGSVILPVINPRQIMGVEQDKPQ